MAFHPYGGRAEWEAMLAYGRPDFFATTHIFFRERNPGRQICYRGTISASSILPIRLAARSARAARDARAPRRARAPCAESGKHTEIYVTTSVPGEPASRALQALRLAPRYPGGQTSTALGSAVPPRFGRVRRVRHPDPVTRSRRAGKKRGLDRRTACAASAKRSGLEAPSPHVVRAAARPSRGLERIGI